MLTSYSDLTISQDFNTLGHQILLEIGHGIRNESEGAEAAYSDMIHCIGTSCLIPNIHSGQYHPVLSAVIEPAITGFAKRQRLTSLGHWFDRYDKRSIPPLPMYPTDLAPAHLTDIRRQLRIHENSVDASFRDIGMPVDRESGHHVRARSRIACVLASRAKAALR
ncbi:hypothetical protein BamIOP4010DRAFT_5195 [Burkholderia ambifaria IOP40-10]|uniref:Uncharacterized protein n=1 Tax=Burkholderia ambifaria IOP40-10 TaxID=396596 RepID=B1FMD4_9BURK|nr:hypothetical protein BamIOP4010DRAFT_5195 [Burkholderia ambifaria IOP40-10]